MIRRRLIIVLSVSLNVLGLSHALMLSPAWAADLYVGTLPGDFPTIQDALDAASDGDHVIVRQGTYTEDVTISKLGITLTPDLGDDVLLDGHITVTAAGGGVWISGLSMAEDKVIAIEDGIRRPASPPPGFPDWVTLFSGGENAYHVQLGNVSAEGSAASNLGGVLFSAHGEGSTVRQTGVIQVKNTASSAGRGASFDVGKNAQVEIGSVDVETGGPAIGVHFFADDESELIATGPISARARDTGSHATGVGIRGNTGTRVSVRDVDVEAGQSAVGVDFNVTHGGSLVHSGVVQVAARESGSVADGVQLGADDHASVSIGSVTVVGGAEARGVTTTYRPGTHILTDGLKNNVSVHIGDVHVSAQDADSEAYGLELHGEDNLSVTAASARASGGQRARGVWLRAGDDLESRFGSLTANGTIAATGVAVMAADRATLQADAIAAQAAAGSSAALGLEMQAGSDTSAIVGTIDVEAGATATGISWRAMGDGGSLTQSGTIDVTTREATSAARGVDVEARDGFSLTVDTVTVEAGARADGITVQGESSTVTILGDVSATARSVSGSARALTVDSSVADVTNFGHVRASAGDAIGAGFGLSASVRRVTFYNLGVVQAAANAGPAVAINVTEYAVVQNEGTIDAGDQVAFLGTASTGPVSLANSGTMLGSVRMGRGSDNLSVLPSGRIAGDVDMGEGADRLLLERDAWVEGDVTMGVGDDRAVVEYGAVLTGWLDGGTGMDALALYGRPASSLPSGSAWTRLSARDFEEALVDGGAWQWGAGTDLGVMDVYKASLRIDDDVTIEDLHLFDGELIGQGRVTGNVINVGGVVAPGSGSFGILTIAGDYQQRPDGVLSIELDASKAPVAGVSHDQLVIVGGTAVFEDGTTVRVRPILGSTSIDRAEYTIVKGDVDFDPEKIRLDIELPRLFYKAWLEEGSMKLILEVTDFDSVAKTPNQKEVSEALEDAKGAGDPGLDDLYDWLAGLDPDQAEEARAAYDSLSGEVYSHLPALASRRLDSFTSATGRGLVYPEIEPEGRVWMVPYGSVVNIRAGAGTAASRFDLSGVVVGADIAASPVTRMGLSLGVGADQLTMDERASKIWGSGYQLGVYSHFAMGRARLTTLLAYGKGTGHSRRSVQFGGVRRQAEAAFSTADRLAWIEARFRSSPDSALAIEPVASLGHYRSRYGSFTEQGAGAIGLVVDGREASWLRGRLGVEMRGNTFATRSGTANLHASLAWVNDIAPFERTYRGRLVGAPGSPFTINGTKAHRSGFEVGLGLKGEGNRGFAWSLDYTGEFRHDANSYTVTARVSYEF